MSQMASLSQQFNRRLSLDAANSAGGSESRLVYSIDFGTANLSHAFADTAENSSLPASMLTFSGTSKHHALVENHVVHFMKPNGKSFDSGREVNAIMIAQPDLLRSPILAIGRPAIKKHEEAMVKGKNSSYMMFERVKTAISERQRRDDQPARPAGSGAVHDGGEVADDDITSVTVVDSASSSGAAYPALQVWQRTLEYLKQDFIKLATTPSRDVKSLFDSNQVKVVMTVPEKWSQHQQSLTMARKAALGAGLISSIDSPNLELVFESESAAVNVLYTSPTSVSQLLVPGSSHMVVDLGGGTTDYCVFSINSTKPWVTSQVLPPSGIAIAGTHVEAAMMKLLCDIAGVPPSVSKDRQVYKLHRWFQPTMRACADAKERLDPAQQELQLDVSALDQHLDGEGKDLGQLVSDYNNRTGMHLSFNGTTNTLSIPMADVKRTFDTIIMPIACRADALLKQAEAKGKRVTTMMLVGGFANCRLVQEELRRVADRHGCKSEVAPHPERAVLEGATRVGVLSSSLYNAAPMQERHCPYSYFTTCATRYISNVHEFDSRRMVIDDDGVPHISGVVVPIVQAGQLLGVSKPSYKASGFIPLFNSQLEVAFPVYRCAEALGESSPLYLDTHFEGGKRQHLVSSGKGQRQIPCTALATLRVKVAESVDVPRHVRWASIELYFGKTEVVAVAESDGTGDRQKRVITDQ